MKKTRTAVGKHSPDNVSILCPECGNAEFERSLSEVGSIVRLAFRRNGNGVKETIIREGKSDFTYICTNCRTTFISDPMAGHN